MFERFTVKAIKSIMHAQEEARRLGHNFVGSEQILLGLMAEGTGTAAKCLKSAGVNLKDIRIEVEKIIGRGSGFVAIEIPFTPRAKRTLEYAWAESKKQGINYIDTAQLLLGLLRAGEGVAMRALENLDVNFDRLKEEILKSLPEKKGETERIEISEGEEPLAKVTKTTNSFLEFLIGLLSPGAQQIAEELEKVARAKEQASSDQEFDKVSSLLDRQIELTEKLRLSSELEDV